MRKTKFTWLLWIIITIIGVITAITIWQLLDYSVEPIHTHRINNHEKNPARYTVVGTASLLPIGKNL